MLRGNRAGRGREMATRMRTLALALTAVLVVLVAQGCGDDADRERAVAALRAEMVANAGMTSRRPVDDQQTACVADGMVSRLGVPTLQRYELLSEDLRAEESIEGVDLSREDADVLADVFADCIDVEALMEREIVAGIDLPRDERRRAVRCVEDAVTAGQVTRTMSLEFQGAPNDVFSRLRDDLASCLR